MHNIDEIAHNILSIELLTAIVEGRLYMQKKKSIMVVWCELKIPSLGITVGHDSESLMMPNSLVKPRDAEHIIN